MLFWQVPIHIFSFTCKWPLWAEFQFTSTWMEVSSWSRFSNFQLITFGCGAVLQDSYKGYDWKLGTQNESPASYPQSHSDSCPAPWTLHQVWANVQTSSWMSSWTARMVFAFAKPYTTSNRKKKNFESFLWVSVICETKTLLTFCVFLWYLISDHSWDVNEYLLSLREKVKSWRDVYWRLIELFYPHVSDKIWQN